MILEVWETEDVAIAWGKHDPEWAAKVHDEFLKECGFRPGDDEYPTNIFEFWENSRARWGKPDNPEREAWAESDTSDCYVEGWTPYMIQGLGWEQ